jgi:hypothetical protein
MGPAGYALRAKGTKELANQILQLLFDRTDIKDLLNLTNLDQCPRYVFTTASALSSLFFRLQVYPKQGKEGEILFAPLSKLAPGSVKGVESSQLAERRALQNKLCMDIAYFYIRIFQIYAALSLTVMDTDPTRAPIFALGKGKPSVPERAPLFGLKGGSIKQIPTYFSPDIKNILEKIKQRINSEQPLKAFQIFDSIFNYGSVTPEKIQLSLYGDKNNKDYKVLFDWSDDINIESGVQAIYVSPTQEKNITLRAEKRDNIWYLLIGDTVLYAINIISGKTRVQILEGDDKMYQDLPQAYFSYRLKKVFGEEGLSAAAVAAPAARAAPTYASGSSGSPSSAQISISPGQSVFLGFQDLKAMFEKKHAGKTDFVFPKAYSIARAMTLLNPIFTQELSRPDPRLIESQVCQATYDFESPSLPEMPRAGKKPNANTYLKSLVALYYDAYQVRGNNIIFTQTESGASELRKASTLLARLYNIEEVKQQSFLQSSNEFRSFSLCAEGGVSAGSRISKRITLKNMDIYTKVFNGAVKPLLDIQEKHNGQVNALFKQMFVIKGNSIQFSSVLTSGSIAALNEIGKKAHDLLLNYYLRSEAYYIRGVVILEENKASLDFTNL